MRKHQVRDQVKNLNRLTDFIQNLLETYTVKNCKFTDVHMFFSQAKTAYFEKRSSPLNTHEVAHETCIF